MVLGRFLIIGQFPLSDFSLMEEQDNFTFSADQYNENV